MNITQEKTGKLTARIKIEIVEQDYLEKYQLEFKNYKKQAALPGFRPGKVPSGIIEKKFGPALRAEEVNKLITESLDSFLKKEKLNILGYPIPSDDNESPDFIFSRNFDFSYDFAFTPEIEISLTEDTEIEYFNIVVGEDVLNLYIKDIQNQFSHAEDSDLITPEVAFKVKVQELDSSGNTITEGINSEASLDFGMIKDDEIKLLLTGLTVGEITFFNPLTAFGQPNDTGKILGIPIDKARQICNNFQFEILSISKNIPAELNQELFEKAFPNDEIKDYESFVERIKKEGQKAYSGESDKLFLHQTLNKLVESTNIELPDDFLKRWLFVSNGSKISKEDIEKEYPQYRQMMITQLIEKELIKQYPEILVTDEDIKNEIKRFYGQYFNTMTSNNPENDAALERIAENFLKKEKEEVQKIEEQLFNQRLINLFKSKIRILEKEVSMNEFTEAMKKAFVRPENFHHDHKHEHDHDLDHEHDHDHEHNQENDHDH